MIIRKATIDDLSQLSVLFDQYRIFYNQPSNTEAAANFLQERFSNNESLIFVAEESDTLLGFTQLYPIFSSVGMKKAWLLNDLFVNTAARNKGVASALLNAAHAAGAETKAGWILLQTGATNKPAQQLYEKSGWQKETDFFYRYDVK